MRDPRDAQPPAERPGPGIPPPGGPASPPPAVGGAPAPGGTRSFGPKPVTFAHWLFWWAHNKDEILHRRTAGRPPLPEEAVRKEIVPALLAVIADDRLHPHIRSEALLALGRSGRAGEHFELVAKHARDWDSGAILALGLLPAKDHPEAGRLLIAKLDDEAAPTRARCFAALSLGLRGEASPEVLACLTRRLDGREAAPDVRVIALLALGLLGNPAPAPDLVRRLEARGPTDLEKAHIIGALGRIGDPAALKPVTAVLRRKGLLARRSAAIALGRLGLEGDAGSRLRHAKLLGRSIRAEGDEAARNFALISLGRFASDPRVEASLHGFCTKALLDHYEKAGRATSGRAHAALALALMSPGDGPVAERLRRDLESRGGSLTRGALALALGIMGDDSKATIALLSRMLGDRGLEKKIRAAAALSLGLLGGPEAGEAVRKALGEREDRDLRMDTATAAGLLGDAEAVPLLLAIFEDQKASVFVLGAAAWSLGRIGDPSAVAALRRILEPGAKDGAYPDLCRAMAANALGQLAARPENRVFHRISADLNYRASVPALDAILAVR